MPICNSLLVWCSILACSTWQEHFIWRLFGIFVSLNLVMHIIFFILFYPILKDVFTELIMKKKKWKLCLTFSKFWCWSQEDIGFVKLEFISFCINYLTLKWFSWYHSLHPWLYESILKLTIFWKEMSYYLLTGWIFSWSVSE